MKMAASGQTMGHSALLTIILQTLSKVKVKCTLVQALRLCTGHMAHRRGVEV